MYIFDFITGEFLLKSKSLIFFVAILDNRFKTSSNL